MSDPQLLLSLLTAIARKDKQAFTKLYQLVSANLYGVAIRIVRNEAAAQDALQDAFVQIWRHAGDFYSSKGSAMAWMVSIVRYRALDIIRKRKLIAPVEAIDLEQVDKKFGSIAALAESEMTQTIMDCLQELSEDQRNMITLAFYNGFTHDELAVHTSIPLGTVKSWIRRGLQNIKTCLEQ